MPGFKTKIGVIEAKDDAGSGMVYGVKAQAKLLKILLLFFMSKLQPNKVLTTLRG